MNDEEAFLFDFLKDFMNEKFPEEAKKMTVADALSFIKPWIDKRYRPVYSKWSEFTLNEKT